MHLIRKRLLTYYSVFKLKHAVNNKEMHKLKLNATKYESVNKFFFNWFLVFVISEKKNTVWTFFLPVRLHIFVYESISIRISLLKQFV